jgi:hypothetical protein
MPEIEVQTPELGSPEGGEELTLGEGGTVATIVTPAPPTPSDPLDDIQDEAARNEAKKHRAIARRATKVEVKKEPVLESVVLPQAGETAYLSKTDFYKSNERKAINSLTRIEATDSDEVKANKTFIKENWNGIGALYVPRGGKDTPEDIVDDLGDAITLFKAKNPPKTEDDSALALNTAPGRTKGGVFDKTEVKSPLNVKKGAKPEEWYSKPK